jgi:hypothetical protein
MMIMKCKTFSIRVVRPLNGLRGGKGNNIL